MKITRRYLAGLLDGEGYFGIMKLSCKGQDRKREYRHGPAIKMASTSHEIISLLQAQFGGYVHYREFPNMNHKSAWCWEVKSFDAVLEIINFVGPYLIIKRPQYEILKEFLETRKTNKFSSGVSEKTYEKRENLYKSIRTLNYRGKTPATTE